GLVEAVAVAGRVHLDVVDVEVRVVRGHGGLVHAGVRAVVVGVELLGARDRGANVGRDGLLVRGVLEAEVRGNRDRQQDADDRDDDEKLDEREAFLASEALLDAVHRGLLRNGCAHPDVYRWSWTSGRPPFEGSWRQACRTSRFDSP